MKNTSNWSRSLAVGALLLPLVVSGLRAQTSYLQPISNAMDTVVSDRFHSQVLGLVNQPGGLMDTFVWDGAAWNLVATGGPAARGLQAMAGCALGAVMIGGNASPGATVNNDTFLWDGTTWNIVTVSSSPSLRSGAANGQLGTGDMVLFGGVETAGLVFRNDTWRFDGVQWSLVPVTGPIPSPRFGAAMSDDGNGNVLLFGGLDSAGSELSDTWRFDGATWTQLFPFTTPGGRFLSAMAADRKANLPGTASRTSVVMAAGLSTSAGVRNDVWVFQFGDWILQPLAAPSAGSPLTCAYDFQRREAVFNEIGAFNSFVVGEFGFTSYGNGCACPGGSMLMTPSAVTPQIGNTTSWDVVGGTPNTFVFMVIDFARGFGFYAPGCRRLSGQNGTTVGIVLDPVGNGTLPLAIPNQVSMIGLELYNQVVDIANMCVSDGIVARIGR